MRQVTSPEVTFERVVLTMSRVGVKLLGTALVGDGESAQKDELKAEHQRATSRNFMDLTH